MDSQNISRQSDLAMKKFWVTQCIWIKLFTTVSMGTIITNCWKLFHCWVKRQHYDKFIGIRELSERISVNCFNNTFTVDTGTMAKNVSFLDKIDN